MDNCRVELCRSCDDLKMYTLRPKTFILPSLDKTCCLGIAPRGQFLKQSAWVLNLHNDRVFPAAYDCNNKAIRAFDRRTGAFGA